MPCEKHLIQRGNETHTDATALTEIRRAELYVNSDRLRVAEPCWGEPLLSSQLKAWWLKTAGAFGHQRTLTGRGVTVEKVGEGEDTDTTGGRGVG